MRSSTTLACLGLAAALGGCAITPEPPAPITAPSQVSRFSGHPPGNALPPGWKPWTLSRFKQATDYRLITYQGRTVVQARAEGAASGLMHPLGIDPKARPYLHWHWKVPALIASADNTTRHLEDSPVRVVVSFAGDHGKLDLHDRIFFDQIRLISGQELPYATLMYIWENRIPRDQVIPNRHTGRIRMIVAQSGEDGLGRWQSFTRNIVEDYRGAFGEEPGRITAVGIMTDTDNTGETAQALYGDIGFQAKPTVGQTASQ